MTSRKLKYLDKEISNNEFCYDHNNKKHGFWVVYTGDQGVYEFGFAILMMANYYMRFYIKIIR